MDERPHRKRGRPPLQPGEASIAVSLRLAAKDFDHLVKLASRERCSIAEVIRLKLKKKDGQP